MAFIESGSDYSDHHIKNFFTPSASEIFLYFLVGIILLIVFNTGNIIRELGGNYIGSPENLKTSFTTLFSGFNSSFSSALGGRLGPIIVWSFVGALAYIGLWLGKNVLNSFENDLISDHYLHPSTYNRVGYWGSSVSVKLFLAAMLSMSVAYVYIVLKAVLPALAALAGSAIYHFRLEVSPFYMIFSLLAVTLVIYIGVVMVRLISHLWKLL